MTNETDNRSDDDTVIITDRVTAYRFEHCHQWKQQRELCSSHSYRLRPRCFVWSKL